MNGVRTSWLAAGSQTDRGRVRGNNEDLLVCDPERGVFAVIDGVGGQSAGEVAAGIARRVMLDRLARPLGTPAERVREAIALANNEIFKWSEQSPELEGMTCVLTLALVVDDRLTIGHVGDSRLYKLGPAGIRKLTHDHSPVGEREDANQLTELEAMRHPRRNEVFRDVGGDCRDKDDEGFVEIVEDTIESDGGILLCTDGLSDMVSSSTIERVVKEHAGDPQAVADALVSAANDAGGKDNITVVYAEAPEFAQAVRAQRALLPRVVADPATETARPDPRNETPVAQGFSPAFDTWRWIVDRRATWFACGTLVGVVAALLLAWRLDSTTLAAARTLVVGSTGAPFTRIADAVNAARAGDVVQLEPGTYAEQVAIPDGVDLVARVPGSATLTSGETTMPEWHALTAHGGGRIYGIRIESKPEAPVAVGIHVSGADRRLELVDIEGPMRSAIELTAASAVTIRGCTLSPASGPAITMDSTTDVTLANNTFVGAAGTPEPALLMKDATRTWLTRNFFGRYGPEIIRGVSPDEHVQLLSGNVVVSSEPAVAR